MADTQYITKNRLSQEVNTARVWVAIIGAPIAGFLMYNVPKFWWIVGLIYLFSIVGAASTKRSGAKGELKTLKLLEQLPDSYVLFNQVDVPNLRAKRGFTELDLVVVGRKGLVEYILSYRPKRSPKNTEKVIQQLVSLKQSSC
ncbi:MAG: NERD domain-containing protein [Idiomarina sp.]|nr:NERD domain-containing protein [Idiomarina sp.]